MMNVQININDYESALTNAYAKLADAEVKIYALSRRVRELETSTLAGTSSTPSVSPPRERTPESQDKDAADLRDIIDNGSLKPKEPDPQKKKEAG